VEERVRKAGLGRETSRRNSFIEEEAAKSGVK